MVERDSKSLKPGAHNENGLLLKLKEKLLTTVILSESQVLTTIIVVSQLMMNMLMALASHMDVIPGSISGLLQLLFRRSSPLLTVVISVQT